MENEKLTDDEIKREKRRKVDKKYSERNKEKISEYGKKYREENKESIKTRKKLFYQNNRELLIERQREYDLKISLSEIDKELKVLRMKEYYIINKARNKEKISEHGKKYREANKEAIAKRKKLWQQNKQKNNINFRVLSSCRSRLHQAVKGKLKSVATLELIGCSVEYLKQHIESQFTDGMNWDNWGYYGWHIDHRIPCSSFDFAKEEDQRECFNYKNLQPLWAKDNLIKGSKY